jgi:hypothetical protein
MHMTTADDGETVALYLCTVLPQSDAERHILGEGITFTNSLFRGMASRNLSVNVASWRGHRDVVGLVFSAPSLS